MGYSGKSTASAPAAPREFNDMEMAWQFADSNVSPELSAFLEKEDFEEYKRLLENYQYDTYDSVNSYLRGQARPTQGVSSTPEQEEKIKEYISHIDDLMAANTLKDQVVVHRVYTPNFFKDKGEGTEYDDFGYTSTSLTAKGTDVIKEAYDLGDIDEDTLYQTKIIVPKGTHAVPIDFITTNNHWAPGLYSQENAESEILIDRGGKYRIDKIDRKNRTATITKIR